MAQPPQIGSTGLLLPPLLLSVQISQQKAVISYNIIIDEDMDEAIETK